MMYITSIFQKKRLGFKSEEDKKKYNEEFKRLSLGIVEKLKPLIEARAYYRKRYDHDKADHYKELIIVARAEHKNALVDLNNRY